MCTVVILRRPNGSDWPLIVAANRDEMEHRRSEPPARHWPDRPEVVAGLDVLAGGAWFGLNDFGVVAAVLNRRGSLGPEAEKRSRGEVVLEALDHADAAEAAAALASLNPDAYRPFNLVIADSQDAFWLRHAGEQSIEKRSVPVGLSMLSAEGMNHPNCQRTTHFRKRFSAATVPRPELGDWSSWRALLASTETAGGPRDAMCIQTQDGYGTVSSCLLALPADARAKPQWLFAPGAPNQADFAPVDLTT